MSENATLPGWDLADIGAGAVPDPHAIAVWQEARRRVLLALYRTFMAGPYRSSVIGDEEALKAALALELMGLCTLQGGGGVLSMRMARITGAGIRTVEDPEALAKAFPLAGSVG